MKKNFTFSLDVDTVKQVKKIAIDEDTGISALVEKLLAQYISLRAPNTI